jgi:hypothetical protein
VAIPSLYNPANYGRYSVCLLSPGVSYPPVFTVANHMISWKFQKKFDRNLPIGRVERDVFDLGVFTFWFFMGFWLDLMINVLLCLCCIDSQHLNVFKLSLNEYVKFRGMIPTPSASSGLLKGWRTPANKLLANCYQFTACNCETILLLYISFKAWELFLCMSGRCA